MSGVIASRYDFRIVLLLSLRPTARRTRHLRWRPAAKLAFLPKKRIPQNEQDLSQGLE